MLHKKTSEPWVTTTASIYAPKKQRLPSEILEGDRKFQKAVNAVMGVRAYC